MAGNAVIGALRVVLGLDSAALDKGLKDARGTFDSFGKSIGTIAAGIGLERIFEKIGAAIGESIKHAVKYGDELSKASQKIGVPIEKLSELKYAAELADVSFESLTTGLAKFNRGIVDAGRGQGQALEAFHALGINIRDSSGALKDNGTLLGEVASKFASYRDGAEKTALAIALFGRAGANMIPLLNLGKQGLESAAEEARKFGLVLSEDAGKRAEEFNDNLKRLGSIWQGIFIKAMGQSISVLEQASAALVKFGTALDLKPIWQLVATTMKEAIAVGYFFIAVIERIGSAWNALTGMFTSDNAARMAAQQKFIDVMKSTGGIFDETGQKTKDFLKYLSDTAAGFAHTGNAAKGAAPALGNFGEGVKKLQGFLDGIIKQTAALQAQGDTIGKTAYEADRLKIINEALAIAGIKNVDVNSKLYQSIVAVAEAHARANEQGRLGQEVYGETRTSYEQFTQRVNELTDAFNRGSLKADLFQRGVVVAQQKLVQSDPYISAFGNSLTTAFDSAIQGGKKLSEVLQQLLRDLARALANAAFKQLLFGGQGGSTPGLLTSIFGGGLPAFASGGSFQVGGAGGIDSQLVAFHASPNEQVTVTKPGQAMGGGMVFNYAPIIDARGADAAAVARLAKSQQDMANTLRPTIRDEVNRYRQQVPGAL